MRKIHILIPSILVASTIPMMAMVSCKKNQPISKVFVHFQTNGGSEIPDVEIEVGQPIAKPDDPTKPEYNFVG
ncbi:MAG: InlB B-repeat-containing protein [Mycoplasmoidaceae bacterium]|nr:InlB B-repeat-containing protein [Mycoplasmoidaceae bacterium]